MLHWTCIHTQCILYKRKEGVNLNMSVQIEALCFSPWLINTLLWTYTFPPRVSKASIQTKISTSILCTFSSTEQRKPVLACSSVIINDVKDLVCQKELPHRTCKAGTDLGKHPMVNGIFCQFHPAQKHQDGEQLCVHNF